MTENPTPPPPSLILHSHTLDTVQMVLLKLSVLIYLITQYSFKNVKSMTHTNMFKDLSNISLPRENEQPFLDLDLSLGPSRTKPPEKKTTRDDVQHEQSQSSHIAINQQTRPDLDRIILNPSQDDQADPRMKRLRRDDYNMDNPHRHPSFQIFNHHNTHYKGSEHDHSVGNSLKQSSPQVRIMIFFFANDVYFDTLFSISYTSQYVKFKPLV